MASGSDQTATFGPPGANLAGDPYSVLYVFDTTKGLTGKNYAQGGSYFGLGVGLPALSAVFAINGISSSIGVPYYWGEILEAGHLMGINKLILRRLFGFRPMITM